MPRKKKATAGRPPFEDRGAVRSHLVTLKLSATEAETLDRVIGELRREKEEEAGGAKVTFTRSSALRWLVQAEAKRRGLA